MMNTLIGTIRLFAFDGLPRGWLPCDGRLLSVEANSALFSLLGYKYGGDDRDKFALPQLEGKVPQEGLHYCIAVEGVYPALERAPAAA